MKAHFNYIREKYRFAWDSALLIIAGAGTGVLYMLVHVVLGRQMGKVEYAQVVALLGLISVLSVFSRAMGFTVTRFVAEQIRLDAVDVWVTIFKRALKRVTICIAVGLLIWLTCSGWLKDFFDAPTRTSIILVGVIAGISLYGPVVGGTLQGTHKFGWQAGMNASTALFRLLLGSLAVWFGFGVDGVLLAVVLSLLFGLLLGAIPVYPVIRNTASISDYDTKPIYRYLWPVLLGQSALYILMFGDVMMSARFLDGDDLAIYGKAATLSRTVLFLAQPVAIAMFPRAVNSSRKILFYAPFIFALITSLGAALFISLFPWLPMKLMYGVTEQAYLDVAALYVWAAVPLSLSGITIKYLWARHCTSHALLLIPVVLVYILLLFFFHDTPKEMIACLAVGGWSSIIVLFLAVLFSKKEASSLCA